MGRVLDQNIQGSHCCLLSLPSVPMELACLASSPRHIFNRQLRSIPILRHSRLTIGIDTGSPDLSVGAAGIGFRLQKVRCPLAFGSPTDLDVGTGRTVDLPPI